jgi:hypothetical protein
VVEARADEILDAVIGLRIGPAELLQLATACLTPDAAFADATGFGSRILVSLDRTRALLARDGRWRVVAGEAHGIRVSYRKYGGSWPLEWRATTPPDRMPITALTIRAADPDVQTVERPAEFFAITIPASAVPMSLDELRAALRR